MKLLNVQIALLLFFTAEVCLAYPQLIRLGYQGCNSCHVSPSGGGTLNGYGRSVSEEIASFGGEGTGALFGGAFKASPPAAVNIGGDTRVIRITTPQFSQTIPMQNDVEIAVDASPEVTVAVSAGKYGPEGELESRRAYVNWTPSEYVGFRVGRWMPNYSLMIPDHSASIKKHLDFNEGQESFNFEVAGHSPWGEAFVTVAAPVGTRVKLEADPAPTTTATTYSYIGRVAAYLGDKAQAGVSYRAMAHPDLKWHHTVGAFGSWGITRELYTLLEYDRNFEFINVGHATDVGYAEVGYEALRGLNVLATYDYYDGQQKPGAGVQWFPVPHLELLARVQYQNQQVVPVLMFHSNW